MKPLDEHEEAWALELVANGSGSWPLKDNTLYDEAVVSFSLEAPDEVRVFLRRQGETIQEYRFQLMPAPAASPSEGKAWLKDNDGRDYRKAKAWFRNKKLAMPRVPAELRRGFIELEDGVFTTRPIQQSPYDIERFLQEAHADIVPDYAILAYHGGDGHDRALHYFLRRGPLDLFLQLRWGQQPTDLDEACRHGLQKVFGLADQLVEAVAKAQREGRLQGRERLRVVASDLRGCSWSATDCGTLDHGTLTTAKQPLEILVEALVWAHSRRASSDDTTNPRPPSRPSEDCS